MLLILKCIHSTALIKVRIDLTATTLFYFLQIKKVHDVTIETIDVNESMVAK